MSDSEDESGDEDARNASIENNNGAAENDAESDQVDDQVQTTDDGDMMQGAAQEGTPRISTGKRGASSGRKSLSARSSSGCLEVSGV